MIDSTAILNEINAIIGKLQDGKWSDHSEALLLSAQGKLAVYQSNVASLVADANQRYLTHELATKNKECERFLAYREEGRTCDDAKCLSKVETEFNCKEMLEAKRDYENLRGVLNAMETLITAIQVQLRAMHREVATAQYQNR